MRTHGRGGTRSFRRQIPELVCIVVALALTVSCGGTPVPRGSPAELAIVSFDPTKLTASVWALAVQIHDHPDELRAAALRHYHDAQPAAHYAALYGLAGTADQGQSMNTLNGAMTSNQPPDAVVAAGALIGRGRADAIPVLIDALSSPEYLAFSLPPVQVWQLAQVALVVYTGQDMGLRESQTVTDATAAQSSWRAWWSSNGSSLRWDATGNRFMSNEKAFRPDTQAGRVSSILLAATGHRLAVSGALTGGGTTYDSSSNTFTVQVDLIGGADKLGNPRTYEGWKGTQTNAKDDYEAAVNSLWNAAFANFAYKVHCSNGSTRSIHFTLKLQINLLPDGARGAPGHHHIWFHVDNPVPHHFVYDPERGDDHTDSPAPYKNEEVGGWNIMYPEVIAHEVGHLLGLGDDAKIDKNGRANGIYDKRGKTIMVSPFAYGHTFDQALINRIGNLAQRAGQLTTMCPPVGARTGSYKGAIDGWYIGILFDVVLTPPITGVPSISYLDIGIPDFVCTMPHGGAQGGGREGGGVEVTNLPIRADSFSFMQRETVNGTFQYDLAVNGTFISETAAQGSASYSNVTPIAPYTQCTLDTTAINWQATWSATPY